MTLDVVGECKKETRGLSPPSTYILVRETNQVDAKRNLSRVKKGHF